MQVKKLLSPALLLIIIVFLFMSVSLLLDEPFVWPDEALYGDIARNIMLENRLGTDLLKGLIRGVENHAYWIPPLFMFSNAAWFKLFGFSIESQRLFSVFLSGVFLIIFYQASKFFINLRNKNLKQFLPLSMTFLLAIDPAFLKASRLSRPEALVLVLVAAALCFYLKTFKSTKNQNRYLLFTGLLLGLAVTAHLIAVCFFAAFTIHLMYLHKKHLFRFKGPGLYITAFIIPILIWLLSIYPNYDLLINQLNLISRSRTFTIPWYVNVLNFPLLLKINYFIYISVSLSFIIFTAITRKLPYILLSLILIFVWLFISLGEIYWYTVYPVPFAFLMLFIFIRELFCSSGKNHLLKPAKITLIALVSFLVFSDFSNYFSLFTFRNSDNYQLFKNQILENIPEGETVFLTSIPDAYFAFDKNRNRLFEFPAFFADINDLKQVLDRTDYIVFSNFFSPEPVSIFLDRYMTKNKASVKDISAPYKVMIIKLKDRNIRD